MDGVYSKTKASLGLEVPTEDEVTSNFPLAKSLSPSILSSSKPPNQLEFVELKFESRLKIIPLVPVPKPKWVVPAT